MSVAKAGGVREALEDSGRKGARWRGFRRMSVRAGLTGFHEILEALRPGPGEELSLEEPLELRDGVRLQAAAAGVLHVGVDRLLDGDPCFLPGGPKGLGGWGRRRTDGRRLLGWSFRAGSCGSRKSSDRRY
jgi:hypothetical protein